MKIKANLLAQNESNKQNFEKSKVPENEIKGRTKISKKFEVHN